MQPQPIVILGGGGFIGSNLARRYVEMGREVIAVDQAFPDFRREALAGAGLAVRDLRVQPQVASVMFPGALVFHLAADMGGVGYFHSDADWPASLNNARITLNVAEAAGRAGVDRLVYASSACACATEPASACATWPAMYPDYPECGGVPPSLDETDLHWGTPDARYGQEKRNGAHLFTSAPYDARVAILHTVYGPLQEHEGVRMKFPAAVATKALAARETGRLEVWGDGTQTRSYLYVDDAVDRLVALAEADVNPGPIMVGAEGSVSCDEIAHLCLELAGVPDAEVVHVDGPTGVAARDCDLSRWREVFGEPHQTSYRDGFAAFVEWLDSLGMEEAA